LQVSGERYELGGQPPSPQNYNAEMLLTTAMYLDGPASNMLTTYLKQTSFHNMDKTELNYITVVKKDALFTD
jgi:hypothetical protein